MEFSFVCDLPTSGYLYTSDAPSSVEDFNFIYSSKSLFIDPSAGHKFPLVVGFVT